MATAADWIEAAGQRADATAVADLSSRVSAILLADDVLAADAFIALAGIVVRAAKDIGGPLDAGSVLTALTDLAAQGLDRSDAIAGLMSKAMN